MSAGRSGSTLLHEILAHHERVAWLSRASGEAPDRPPRQRRIVRAASLPAVGDLVRRRWPPDECYPFWDHHFPGFGRPFRDLGAGDVMPPVRAALRRYFGGLLSAGRPTLLVKVTGWPRAGFLANVLEGARFVHLVRDGREVARSLLTVPWWLGWRGPSQWRFGPLGPEEEAEWERSGRSFAVLAAIQWRRLVAAAERAREEIGAERWLDLRYEELCADPEGHLSRIAALAGLPPSRTIASVLARGTIRSPRSRWAEELSPSDRDAVDAACRPALERWGYA